MSRRCEWCGDVTLRMQVAGEPVRCAPCARRVLTSVTMARRRERAESMTVTCDVGGEVTLRACIGCGDCPSGAARRAILADATAQLRRFVLWRRPVRETPDAPQPVARRFNLAAPAESSGGYAALRMLWRDLGGRKAVGE